jgi:hypothetical protein
MVTQNTKKLMNIEPEKKRDLNFNCYILLSGMKYIQNRNQKFKQHIFDFIFRKKENKTFKKATK